MKEYKTPKDKRVETCELNWLQGYTVYCVSGNYQTCLMLATILEERGYYASISPIKEKVHC